MAFTDVEMAIFAQLAYQKIPNDSSLHDVLTMYRQWLVDELGGSYEKHIDKLIQKVDGKNYKIVATENKPFSGLNAYAFTTPDNEVVVAARGTQAQVNDIVTDADLAFSLETQQHRDMADFVQRLESYGYDGYYFTGHSLGGNVATHGAISLRDRSKVKGVYAFNAPGFNDAYWIYNGWKLREIKNIKNFENEYDYVSSILRSPGETIVIDSSKEGSHWWFHDHSICNYSVNDDGTFKSNKTGLKSVQTIAGKKVGDLGEKIAWKTYIPQVIAYSIYGLLRKKYITRDFSDASMQKMLSLVSQVENEKWSNFTDWVGDRWYDFESWIGTLDIKRYIDNVNSYHKKVIDKNNATADTIKKIFAAVHSVDASSAGSLENVTTTLSKLKQYVESMSQIVASGDGEFTRHVITGKLNGILDDIEKATIQQMKESLMKYDSNGEPVVNEELLLEYIKKNPGEMTEEEMHAVVETIKELQDTVAFYKTAWSWDEDAFGVSLWNRAGWVSETNKFESFSAVSAHYNQYFVNLMDACLECGVDSNTFAAALLKISNGEDALSILGVDISADVSKIFGSASIEAYAAKWKTEHSEQFFGKLELSEKAAFESSGKLENVSDRYNKWQEDMEDRLIDKGLYDKDKITEYYDKDFNEIDEKDAPDFYERKLTLGELSWDKNISTSVYDGTFDTMLGGKLNVTVCEAEAHGSLSGGFYIIGKDDQKIFSPGVSAEVGASVTVFNADYENQLLGNEMLGVNVDAEVTALSASAGAEANVNFMGKDDKGNIVFDPQVNVGIEAEAVLAEAEGSIGANILGGEVELQGSVKVGVGVNADVGIKDGVIKCEIGASLGIGFDVGFEVDVGGMVDTVADAAASAWDDLKNGWDSLWD